MKDFILKILRSESKESSKRLLALLTFIIVVIIVSLYTNEDNLVMVLDSLLLFITVLLGITAYYDNKKEKV